MPRPVLFCLTIVAAFQVHLAAAPDVSQDVPVPGGIEAMAQSLGLPSAPDRARFVAELARLTYPAAEGTQTTRAKVANSWRGAHGKAPASSDARSEMVPIPLTVAVWSQAVFRRTVAPEEIVAAILSDPRSAHLCYGLAGSDDETLQFLIDHPNLIKRLYEDSAASFAAFGSSLRIHQDRVVPPGAAGAADLWEAVVGEKLDRPEAFVRSLFGGDQGRVAYLYDTIADLDPARAAFALGLWMKDPAERLTRFKALLGLNHDAFPQWQPAKFPFSRPLYDIATLLTRVRVEPDGSPSFPAMRSAWAWAFESLDVPAEPLRLPAHAPDDGPIDAAWLAQALALTDSDARNDRLDQLAFGQRVFAASDAGALGDILIAIRAFPRCRMLMLTLERIGVKQMPLYAAAARRAQQLSALESRRQFVALGQFQSALALVARMAAVRTLDVAAAERLVLSLTSIAPNGDGRYQGAIAAWLQRDLRAALIAADVRLEATTASGADDPRGVRLQRGDDLENALIAALAGSRGEVRTSTVSQVSWEGQVYRLDLVAAEQHRLRRVRERQGGPLVDLPLGLAEVVRKLAGARITVDDVSAASAALKSMALDLVASGPDGVQHREPINRAVEELSKVSTQAEAQKLAHVVPPLSELCDELLVDALMNWAYALSIADADSPVLLTGNLTRRHDFGSGSSPGSRRARLTSEWAQPRPRIAVGIPWHVTGSLLGLDVALSSQALRRVDGNRVVDAPSLSTNEREAFANAVALLNPFDLHDRERDVIVDAIARGRIRVAALGQDAGSLAKITAEIRMDGWRRRALQWTMTSEPTRVESLFSLTELLQLGGASGVDLDAWGVSAIATSGCFCTRLAPPNQWRTLLGRPQLGLMAATVPDLNLHVAAMLRELHLPAAITKSILTAAVQDFIDEVRPTDANDWLTLVRTARTAPRERIEDYVAVATADGPLVPNVAAPIQ